MIGVLAYSLCALTAFACSVLLLRGFRRSGARLLLWSGLCFGFLALNNFLVVFDLVVFPHIDLFLVRNVTALTGVSLLLYGLIWEAE